MHFPIAVAAALVASAQLAAASPAGTPTKITARQYDEPCALVASASASYMSLYPSATAVSIPAEVAYNCLQSVPFYTEPAMNLTDALKPIIQLQSTVDYLRAPPEGYLYSAVDLPRGLDAIQTKILSDDSYTSEYDFQLDVSTLLTTAKDGHLYFTGDVASLFFWSRPGPAVVSVSLDGVSVPEIYALADILAVDSETVVANVNPDASPIASINGLDVATFFVAETNSLSSQDPDANWNYEFFTLQRASSSGSFGAYLSPQLYPGPTTTLVFKNGSSVVLDNYAITRSDFTGITNGDDVYATFCQPDQVVEEQSLDSLLSKRESADDITPLYYPTPEVIDPLQLVQGYFLPDTDVAVLCIYAFTPADESKAGLDFMVGFQQAIEDFLALSVQEGKTKLVIDLQGNGGGSIDLATDAFAQLFPTRPPNTMNNLRASIGMYGVVTAASNRAYEAESTSDEYDDAVADVFFTPFDYQDAITPDGESDFQSISSFYGPNHVGHGTFTSFFQMNYTNDRPTEFGLPTIVITGTNNRTDFTQPFAAENIVMVTEGYCASACTIFSELMKAQGVPVIALGGRPQTGPMQAVGGVKGSQIFQPFNLQVMMSLFNNETLNTALDKASGTIWENFNSLPIARSNKAIGVNGKNQFRIGDDTQTALHFVYEAADCRLFFTPDMLADPTVMWATVAALAFENRTGNVITSPLCVADSTQHPTSLSGGLKPGEIGDQTVPDNARPAVTGFLLNGTNIVDTWGAGSEEIDESSEIDPSVVEGGEDSEDNDPTDGGFNMGVDDPPYKPYSSKQVKEAVGTINSACSGYKGDEWFVKLMCSALTSSK